MPKKPVQLIPLKCPYCRAAFAQGKQNNQTGNDEVLTFTYGCGARAALYKIPGGYRLDVLECKGLLTHQQKIMEGSQKSMFNEE